MKVTMQLTLDDLIRTLRAKAHRVAEEIETGYARHRVVAAGRGNGEPDRMGAEDDVVGA